MTKRDAIAQHRKNLKENHVDSGYTAQHLYNDLLVQTKWLVKREETAGRIYQNSSLFQTLRGREVIEVSTVPSCLNIRTGCKIYRTKHKLPEMWLDKDGPIIKFVASVDNSTKFQMVSVIEWDNKKEDPYRKFSKEKYCFFLDGYLWFPEQNPHYINIHAFFIDDVSMVRDDCTDCNDENNECIRFLDTPFMIPDWLEGEMFAQALRPYLSTGRLQEDQDINKNQNRKN